MEQQRLFKSQMLFILKDSLILEELRYYKVNDQICITNQKTLDNAITFKKAYEVK
jgi:hypothetical protein